MQHFDMQQSLFAQNDRQLYYTKHLFNSFNLFNCMKRKVYRQRQTVTLSAEKDRWHDFEDLCDKERKSVSLKVAEMIDEELQKNALGDRTPISISYGKQQEKPLQPTLEMWLGQVYAAKDDEKRLNILEGDALTVASAAKDLRKQAFRNRILRK